MRFEGQNIILWGKQKCISLKLNYFSIKNTGKNAEKFAGESHIKLQLRCAKTVHI